MLRNFIRSDNLISREDKILIGVSGGMDSMVLLHLLFKLQKEIILKLGIAHVNYNLRDKDSILDEKLTEKTVKILNIPFFLKSVKLKTLLNNKKTSLQNWPEK